VKERDKEKKKEEEREKERERERKTLTNLIEHVVTHTQHTYTRAPKHIYTPTNTQTQEHITTFIHTHTNVDEGVDERKRIGL